MSYTIRQPCLNAVNPAVALPLTIESLMHNNYRYGAGYVIRNSPNELQLVAYSFYVALDPNPT